MVGKRGLVAVSCAILAAVSCGEPGATATSSTARAQARVSVPPLTDAQRAAHLRDIRSIVPDAIVDMRYATRHNFVGERLYPRDARCLVHRSMAPGLRTAAARLRARGLVLVFWDCYRPHHVQVRMYRHTPNPAWVAKPTRYARSHEAARSVDVTLAWADTAVACPRGGRIHRHCRLVMGTKFDDFTPRAYAYATEGVGTRAQHNRAVLRRAMAAGGITVYSGEWWHFDGPGALVPRPLLVGVTVD
ncbi:MAG: zinc D-Ala-D-Ala dipeptidase [Pseudonocardiales bacterium]|jgi:D-alanyl-D-alanine dipeptidase|nr:zinc D-Ala-D-Ala dipeptidase [Pseudonocardiales bacterium]MDT4920601.1 zinc D-Ala-D-Ala dipeptidase [Pseudonocardiales bacterium]